MSARPPLWYVGTTWIGRLGDEDCPETLEEAAEDEARSRRSAAHRRQQTTLCPSTGCWLDTDHMTAAERAEYEALVQQHMADTDD